MKRNGRWSANPISSNDAAQSLEIGNNNNSNSNKKQKKHASPPQRGVVATRFFQVLVPQLWNDLV